MRFSLSEPPSVVSCYDHALLVTGYDVLLSTLQGNPPFSTSSHHPLPQPMPNPLVSASWTSFTSRYSYWTHASKPHHVHCLTDSLVPCYRYPFPLDVIMTYDSDPDSDLILSYDIIAYRSPTIRPLPLTLTIHTAIRYWLIPLT